MGSRDGCWGGAAGGWLGQRWPSRFSHGGMQAWPACGLTGCPATAPRSAGLVELVRRHLPLLAAAHTAVAAGMVVVVVVAVPMGAMGTVPAFQSDHGRYASNMTQAWAPSNRRAAAAISGACCWHVCGMHDCHLRLTSAAALSARQANACCPVPFCSLAAVVWATYSSVWRCMSFSASQPAWGQHQHLATVA